MQPVVQNISDTAKWVAIFRAEESERSDALFYDPYARKLAGDRGEQIANAIAFSRQNSWSFVARTYLIDEFIRQHIDEGYDTIVNLAAGLDTRPYRMQLPATLKWIEVDLPGILDYKASILQGEIPKCSLQTVKLDLANRKARLEFFSTVGNNSDKILVLTEGLIPYLTDEQAGAFAEDLSAQSTFHRWVFDLMSPGLLVLVQKEMNSVLSAANAPLIFAPQEGEYFFERYGWKPLVCRSNLQTAAALNRLSEEMLKFAALPEPEGPKGDFPWSGVCLFENTNAKGR